MRAPDGVREQVLSLLLAMILLVTTVAGAGALGVIALTDDVEELVDDLRPAAYSNIALRNDMSKAQAAVRGWALTGRMEFRERFRRSTTEAQAEIEVLEAYVADDSRLSSAVAREAQALDAWLAYVDDLVGDESAGEAAEASTVVEGQQQFDRFEASNDAVSYAVNAEIDARGEDAGRQGGLVLGVLVLVSLLGLAATALVCLSLVRRVSRPLREMETAVERLAAGDLDARADVEGPRETRRVASALNVLAQENQRAREMEEHVVDQLRRLDRAKDDFVSTVSHELRTPLTSIAGYIELFEDGLGEDLTPHQHGMLTVVRRNVDRLRSLIEDLLTLSRVESDAFRTSFAECDVAMMATEVVHDMAAVADEAGVRVATSTPLDRLVVHGDPGQLSRAVLNLVSNAVKFSPAGGEVAVDVVDRSGEVVVEVRDRGIGIPADELATLGTRFFRASNAVEAEINGTGLGLRIVQTVADNHGGRFEIASHEGVGTTARLALPLVQTHDNGNISRVLEITEG